MKTVPLLSAVVAVSADVNPFSQGHYYVNPTNMAEYDTSIATAYGVTKTNLQGMKQTPSAYWIDTKSKIDDTSLRGMRGILANAQKTKELVVFMHYDVPNRDCKAVASNGEICCTYKANRQCDYTAGGSCEAGLQEYKSQYVDKFVKALKDFPGVPVVVVVEPDSLPNLITNSQTPRCGDTATQAAYKTGISYAIKQLQTSHATLYIDAAHGGWLGWDNNLQGFMKGLKAMDIKWSGVRGFAQNVANYQPVGTTCPWKPDQGSRNSYCLPGGAGNGDECCADPCKLESQYNPNANEMNFAQALSYAAREVLGFSPRNIIDTGRNGVVDSRTSCSNWCNPRGMGAGIVPTTSTNSTFVDAFFWLKTPGESDGCTQTTPDGSSCLRFDTSCGSSDSIGSRSGEPHAPEAGKWFDYQVKMLAANAVDTNWPGPVPPSPPVPPTPVPPTPVPPTPAPPTPAPPTPSPSGTCSTQRSDCTGQDIGSVAGYSAEDCCSACQKQSGCGAAVFVQGGQYTNMCFLKSVCIPASGCAGDSCTAVTVGGGPTPPPPTPPPPTPPTPPPPTPPPPTPSNCPGGSLSACIDLCPAGVFAACVASCQRRCPHFDLV